jgi:hypothetical protein
VNRYLVRLNGAPLIFVECPHWMDPVTVAREYMNGNQAEGVTVTSALDGVS